MLIRPSVRNAIFFTLGNPIDFILIPRRWRSSVLNARATSHNTVLDSDHRMVTVRLKLKKYTNTTRATRYNVQALHSAETAQRFNNEVTCLLGDLDGSEDIIKHWNNIKRSLHTAAEKILGEPKKQNRSWISHETLALIDKRSRARTKLSKAKLRREIKKAVSADKSRYYSELADEVIAADESGNTWKMYSLIKKLTGIGPTSTDILKDESGHTDEKEKSKPGQIISRTC